jgi:hypothetical protein
MLPLMADALVSAVQPSVVLGSAPVAASSAWTRSPATGVAVIAGPNAAVPPLIAPAMDDGDAIESPGYWNRNICMRGLDPSCGVPKFALLRPDPSWASALTASLPDPPFP